MSKLYNIGAYGIPANVLAVVRTWDQNLRWTTHAKTEAASLVRNLGFRAEDFSLRFIAANWEIVEVEVDSNGIPGKVVARRPVPGSLFSLVIVTKADGTVKTCWANLTTDKHRTLNLANYNKASDFWSTKHELKHPTSGRILPVAQIADTASHRAEDFRED